MKLFLVLLILMMVSGADAANIVRYVDPESAGGDGTTNALSGAQAAYVSLSAAEDALDGTYSNLVSDGNTLEIICDSNGPSHTADSAPATIEGWTTGVDNYIYVHTPLNNRHSGKWDDTKYRMDCTGAANDINIKEDYVYLDGLQLTQHSVTGNGALLYYGQGTFTQNSNRQRVSNCILKGDSTSEYRINGIYAYAGYVNFDCWNTIIYDINAIGTDGHGIYFGGGYGSGNISSVTAIGGYYAIRTASSTTVANIKNCYANASVGGSTDYNTAGTTTLTTCASSDSTGSADLRLIEPTSSNFVSVADPKDYHITSGSALKGTGTDTSGDVAPMNFVTDIDQQTISAPWCVGADYYVSPVVSSFNPRSRSDRRGGRG